MTETPTDSNIEQLPYRRPSGTCNAQLHREDGYCDMPAGAGTDHEGRGRCKLHGGDVGDMESLEEVEVLFKRLGFDVLIDAAEAMRHSDQEYLMEVGNNALVLQRTNILGRLQDPTLTPREVNDLTNSLTRIDNLIAKHPNGSRATDAPGKGEKFATEDDAELARVLKLRGGRA